MTLHAKGPFDVKILPQPADEGVGHEKIARMGLDKKFHGDLEAVSLGQMLAFMGDSKDSGSYVAVERVDGALGGKKGTFALHHLGIMDARRAEPDDRRGPRLCHRRAGRAHGHA